MHLSLRTLGLSLLLWTCHAVTTFGATIFEVGGIYYKVQSTTVTVVKHQTKGEKYSGDVVIPSIVSYKGKEYTVMEIGTSAFQECINLTSIELPSTLKQIDARAFLDCSALKEVVIPSHVSTINTDAFANCSELTTLWLSDSLTFIGGNAFCGCTNLAKIISPRVIPANQLSYNPSGFDYENYEYATLYVPVNSKSNYENYVPLYNDVLPSNNPYWAFDDIVEYGNIVDGEEYTQDFDINGKVKYTRNFKNTSWQPLYVPFAIPVDSLSAHGLQVAALDDTQAFDGKSNKALSFTTLTEGKTKANCPYLIKAKEVGEVKLVLKNTDIVAAEEVSIESTSDAHRFCIVGTYEGVTGTEMYANDYYALAGGALKRAASNNGSLKAQRWYLKIQNQDGTPASDSFAASLRFVVDGLEEDGASGIETCREEQAANDTYYSLGGYGQMGRTAGLSIHNGKIILIRK